MDYFEQCFADLAKQKALVSWRESLPEQLHTLMVDKPHGDMPRWQRAIDALPEIESATTDFSLDCLQIGSANDLTPAQKEQLRQSLVELAPWKKGPFNFFGTHIDTEWRSDWKWQRIEKQLSPLKNRIVLDVGCGSGYHLWRMHAEGAKLCIGIDPSRLFLMQFQSVKKYQPQASVHYLPLRLEELPSNLQAFDTVFSMGVLYHRRSPLDHLLELKSTLKPGGELVIETLIIDGEDDNLLFPEDRYAMMPNVFFLPSVTLLSKWLERMGFENIRVIDINKTSLDEQRSTEWMEYKSLKDFLDPNNTELTAEGYPAPLRATLIANKPQ